MARKKTKEDEELIEDNLDEEDDFENDISDEDDFDQEFNDGIVPNSQFNDDNIASNSLEYASIVSSPSEIAKNTKYNPQEVRYAFYDKAEASEIKHWSKVYRNYQYLKKVFVLQAQEDVNILNNRLTLYQIETEEDFEEYCRNTHNMMAYNAIKNNSEIKKELIDYIKGLQENGFYEDIRNQNEVVTGIYDDYKDNNQIPNYMDDIGLAGNILTTSLVSMGREGNERHSTIMSIQATKDIDIKKAQEEKTEYKNKLGGFLKKFN